MCHLPDGMSAIFQQYLAHPAPVSEGAGAAHAYEANTWGSSWSAPGSWHSLLEAGATVDRAAWEGVQPAVAELKCWTAPTGMQHPTLPAHWSHRTSPRTRILLAPGTIPWLSIPTFAFPSWRWRLAPGSLLPSPSGNYWLADRFLAWATSGKG